MLVTIAVSYLLAFLSINPVNAHIALWSDGMFGLNWPAQANSTTQYYNNNDPVVPLRQDDNLTTAEWFAHGLKDYPPVEGNFLNLVSGANITAELSCNRAFTSYRSPSATYALYPYACSPADEGALHTANVFGQPVNNSYFGGTAIAISYSSDAQALQPENMTVITVNSTSPWTYETIYMIPSGLPTCPSGGCLCTWNWIHEYTHGEGYGPEIYNVLYRCNVTGDTNDANHVGVGDVPNYCENDTSNCTTGPKVPMYIFQADGNNMGGHTNGDPENPSYNLRYGFSDGPQDDAIVLTANSKGFSNFLVPPCATALGIGLLALLFF